MIVQRHTQGLQTIDEIRAFVEASQAAGFEITDRDAAHRFISQTLRQFGYTRRGRADKGVLRADLMTMTGLSRAQVSRRIRQYRDTGRIRDRRDAPAQPFTRRYTGADARALADLDASWHGQLSGPATRKLCQRAWHVFGDSRYERLAGISNGHLYNLRHSIGYQRPRGTIDKTRPAGVPIAERRRPEPNGAPGYLRVNSVHQGDLDGVKGKIRKTYPADLVATSDEKLKSLPDASSYLKDGIDFETLDAQAHQMSDNEAARHLNDVKAELFQSTKPARTPAA